ncbi:hypothetical protein EDD11_010367 [Mortierella claussenii]|nr:hypothetical protein EDD11_010367 [Mortierella claussenii]
MDPLRYMLLFLGSITMAFFFEAFPRQYAKVQKKSREKEHLSRFDQANLFSRLVFHYIQPMMSMGSKGTLIVEDIGEPLPQMLKTRVNHDIVSDSWQRRLRWFRKRHGLDDGKSSSSRRDKNKRQNKGSAKRKDGNKPANVLRGPSLMLAVLDAYKWRIVPTILIRLLSFALMYAPIFLFSYLLKYFTDYGEALKNGTTPPAMARGLLIAVGIFIGNVASALFLSMSSHECTNLAIEARAALVAMVYRKSLKLSPMARSQSTLGEISNHMAVDAESWMQATNMLPLVFTIPLELGLCVWLLYRLLGWSLLAGVAVFTIITPIQTKLAGFLHSFQRNKLKAMDSRLRLMTEILSNIKIVKLQAWEDAFHRKIDILRASELGAQRALATVRSVLVIVFSSVNLLILLATFAVYSNWGGPDFTPAKMTPEIIFVGITLFTILGRPLGLIPVVISHLILLRNANGRIQQFLLLEEIDSTVVEKYPRRNPLSETLSAPKGRSGKEVAIEIVAGTFAWDKLLAEEEDEIDQEENKASATLTEEQAERQPLLSNAGSSKNPTPVVHTPKQARLSLMDIHIQILDGHLTAIVGRIGQGKSSLLSSIIGEMYKINGTVRAYGNVAYVPQQAWIVNATLRDNILFGKAFDQQKYNRIIFAANLGPDIDMLPAGDLTEIGERGINLSGGQKQRVSLARAAYQDADVYLLDDPLSAVDAHVDQHLWEHLIGPKGLWKDKTRLLVTHGIHHLDETDQILVMKEGKISETGEYKELMEAKQAFWQLIMDYSVQERRKIEQEELQQLKKNYSKKQDEDNQGVGEDGYARDDDVATKVGEVFSQKVLDDGISSESVKGKYVLSIKKDGEQAGKQAPKQNGGLIGAEILEQGKVGWRVYLDYAKAISLFNAMICLLLYTLAQASQIATNFWLRYWATADEREDRHSIGFYLCGYALLVTLFLTMDVVVNYMSNVVCGIQGARTLHDKLLTRVLRMPMSFFDTTPMGRIVNRFSSDVTAVDSNIPEQLPSLLSFIFTTLAILVVIAYSTPLFLIALPPLMIVFFTIQSYYVKTSGQLKRLQSAAKSPLYQHFSESLAGGATIRCQTGLINQFIFENERRSDQYGQATYLFMLTSRWLTIRIQTLCATTVFLAAALAVLNAHRLDSSLVGLALSYALNLTNVIVILVRLVSEVQNQFVSVERIREYTRKPIEAPLKTKVEVSENWPGEGRIEFKEFSARYREGLALCIKDATFTIMPQEKVGVVGRTGAGKSSLALSLFRIIEAADSYWAKASDPNAPEELLVADLSLESRSAQGGRIEIDGVDISTLGLKDLRSHLSIIPQDPTLFAGSVRDNLDPFKELEDADLWEALERAHLKGHISTLEGGLSFEVGQNGDNFSVGQRSLICLARALLRKSKVLVLDEATAAVDVETDELIQKTIRSELKDRTILTIAHRIKTVMDSDKILVLEQGYVEEFAAPKDLLRRQDQSLFFRLAQQAGEI